MKNETLQLSMMMVIELLGNFSLLENFFIHLEPYKALLEVCERIFLGYSRI